MNGRVFRTINMRIVLVSVFTLLSTAGVLCRGDDGKPFPLWDGVEPVSSYARRVGLPEEQSIDLGGGESLKLALVPAGQFVMGAPAPEKPKSSISAGVRIILSGCALVALLLLSVVLRAIRQRK